MEILTIETTSLGDRSYVVTDGEVAAVVDPQRDIDRVIELVDARGLQVTDVFETHVHNDYVTGGLALARDRGARYHVSGDVEVEFDRTPIRDGDEVSVGAFVIRAVHTPGHTPDHLSYVANDGTRDVAAFTGGSLLYGSVGRTDLVDPSLTEDLTRAQFASARRLAELGDETEVYPSHGFGSFCSSGDTTEIDRSTIGRERQGNDALTTTDEETFVRELMAGLDAYPAYYAHMGPLNREGPEAPDLSPVEKVDPTELARRIHTGEWVVDLRNRMAFARDHLTGTINIELDDQSSTYLGWLIPWGTPVTLMADTPTEVEDMQRQLVRIGIDRPAGQHTGELPTDGDHGSYEVTDFAGLRRAVDAGEQPWVLDSRRDLEWEDGHLPFAHHVPLHELLDRMDEAPTDQPVWIHCGSGYRAAIGASLLARAGRPVVLVDDLFDTATDHFELA